MGTYWWIGCSVLSAGDSEESGLLLRPPSQDRANEDTVDQVESLETYTTWIINQSYLSSSRWKYWEVQRLGGLSRVTHLVRSGPWHHWVSIHLWILQSFFNEAALLTNPQTIYLARVFGTSLCLALWSMQLSSYAADLENSQHGSVKGTRKAGPGGRNSICKRMEGNMADESVCYVPMLASGVVQGIPEDLCDSGSQNAIRKAARWREGASGSVGGPVILTWTVSRPTSHLRNIEFFSKCLISDWSRQCTHTPLDRGLFEALLLSVGISGSQTVTSAHSREKKDRIGLEIAAWGWGWITLRGHLTIYTLKASSGSSRTAAAQVLWSAHEILVITVLWCLTRRHRCHLSAQVTAS